MKAVFDWTYKAIMFVCKLLLIGDILITTWSVAGRYIPFITDPHWSEEMVLTMMVYMSVLSATLAIRKKTHIRMTALDKYMSPGLLRVLDLMADLAVAALGIILIVYGIQLCTSPLSVLGKYASMPGLGKIWQYLSMPIAGLGMIIFEAEQIVLDVGAIRHPEQAARKGDE